jgi:uncharacterized protein (TIGR02145 family)
MNTKAGTYKTTITYTAIGEEVLEPPEIACVTGKHFKGAIGDIIDAAITTQAWDIGDTGIATDDRGDGQEYCIGKLADNNIWMLNNLKLGSLDNTIELTPADTNITADWTLPQIDNTITSYDYEAPRLYAMVDGQSNFSLSTPNSTETDITSQNFAGYYYNWCAATAGLASTTCKPSNEEPPDATQDICPANWRMPTGGSSGEFAILNGSMYNNTPSPADASTDPIHAANFQFNGPFRGDLAGFRNGSYWGDQGYYGSVWSTSHYPGSSYNAFELYFGSDNVRPNDFWNRYGGLSVRCLLR